MGERVIARRKTHHILSEGLDWEPDPDAPSVAEVVEVLRDARRDAGEVRDIRREYLDEDGADAASNRMSRLDDLIARLEGE